MWHFAFTQMRNSLGKLLLASIAIALGTGFVSATLLATSVMRTTAESIAVADLNGANIVARYTRVTDEQVRAAEAVPGVRAVDHRFSEGVPVRSAANSYYLEFRSLPSVGTKPEIIDGKLPAALNEVAFPENIANSLKLKVGDTFTWTTWNANEGGTLHLVGITKPGLFLFNEAPAWASSETVSTVRSSFDVTDADRDSLMVYTDGSRDVDAVAKDVERAAHVRMETAQSIIDQQVEIMVGNAQFFVLFGLAFAAVAVGVAAMVIANTFEVLVAQRTKSLALLRCGGATKGQIRRSVLIEAMMVGIISSIVGVLLGHGIGHVGLWWVSRQSFGVVTPGLLDVNVAAIVVPLLVGVTVTVLAALGPARAATRVSPVAALRPTTVDPVRSGGVVRKVLGIGLLLLGTLLLAAPAVFVFQRRATDQFDDLDNLLGPALLSGVAGGLLFVAGFLVMAVYIVPCLVAVLGWLLALITPRRAKATVQLATANAIRNPRRTATTTSALVIGVGLVTLMATGAASGRATVENSLDEVFPTEVMVTSNGEEPLSDALVDQVSGIDGVERVAKSWSGTTEQSRVLIATRDDVLATVETPEYSLQPGHVGVNPREFPNGVPANVQVEVTDAASRNPRAVTLPTQQLKGLHIPMVAEPNTFTQLGIDLGRPSMLLLDVDDERVDGVVDDTQTTVAELGGDSAPSVVAPLQERQAITQVIDAIVAVMIGLLAVAVVIALVGVANTLTLSVIERRREHGMLRSVGVTGGQLRGMLAAEGMLIAVVGALIGMAIGVFTGFVGSAILLGATPGYTFSVDWRVMAGCLAVAIVAGLLASVAPARSAVRVPVVVALAAE